MVAMNGPLGTVEATVYWEETGEELHVVKFCGHCQAGPSRFDVVSPRGVAHYGGNHGCTKCGVDASGSKWWWRL